MNPEYWRALAQEARSAGLPLCVVFAFPRTMEIMERDGRAADDAANLMLPAWRRLVELWEDGK